MIISNSENSLTKYFNSNHDGRLIHKWLHYFDIYDKHFRKFKGKKITLVEFGVSHGGSLDMWREYFGKRALIIGVDINPECAKLISKNTEIYIGDQSDKKFLLKLSKQIGPVDIIIDDGGHTVEQQIATFDVLYKSVSPGGVYLVEDLHTNYWEEFGGRNKNNLTFIEKSKQLVDQLNAWHSRDDNLRPDEFTRTTRSMHFYDSIIVFEKDNIEEPAHKQMGKQSLSSLESWDYKASKLNNGK